MKVRWTRESVRFRITPDELESLLRNEPVREILEIGGPECWIASLIPGCPQSSLSLTKSALYLALSIEDLEQLSGPESEGVYLVTAGIRPIRYSVEKDFPCIHPRGANALEAPGATFEPPADFEARKR